MGCGCNKAKANNVVARANRSTVYQVMQGTEVVGEFAGLPEARAKAVEINGRVRVTSKSE